MAGSAVDDDQYFEIWASIFDDVDQIQIQGFPRNEDLISEIADHPKIERLAGLPRASIRYGDQMTRSSSLIFGWVSRELMFLTLKWVFKPIINHHRQFSTIQQRPDLKA